MSALSVTFRDKRFVVCNRPCMRSMKSVWDTMSSICMSWRDFQGNSKHLFWEAKDEGRQRTTCPLFAYSLYKISEIHKSTKPFAVWIIPNHSHERNHLCRDVFLHSKRTAGIRSMPTYGFYGNQVELLKNQPSILSVTVTQRRKL